MPGSTHGRDAEEITNRAGREKYMTISMNPNKNVAETAHVKDSSILGEARVEDETRVEDSVVEDHAVVRDHAIVKGARLQDVAEVGEGAVVTGDLIRGLGITIRGQAKVSGHSRIRDRAHISGQVYDMAQVNNRAKVFDRAKIFGGATLSGDAVAEDDAQVFGWACLHDRSRAVADAKVFGEVRLYGNMVVGPRAEVFRPGHAVYLQGVVPSYEITMYRTSGGGHRLSVGCQSFTLDDLAEVEELAENHGVDLPDQWETMARWLQMRAQQWRSDDPCGYQGED